MSRKSAHRWLTSAIAVAFALAPLAATPALAQGADTAPATNDTVKKINRGPEVKITDATVEAGKESNHNFTITDPEGDDVVTAYWIPIDDFNLEYVSGDTWRIRVENDAKPGVYEVSVQGQDALGNFGDVARAKITVTPKVTPPAPKPTQDPVPPPKPPAPQPTKQPVPPPADQRPTIDVKGGEFDNRKENKITFTVNDPLKDDRYVVWWYPLPGSTMKHVKDDTWEITIAKGAKVGKYDLRMWVRNSKGVDGPEVKVPVTIFQGKDEPKPQPPAPQPTKDPQPPAPKPTDPPKPPVPPTPTDPPKPPKPTDPPKPTPPPAANKGPVIDINPGVINNHRDSVIHFTVTDPEGDAIANVEWQPIPHAHLRRGWDNNWHIFVDDDIRPGTYPIKMWAFDVRGNKGPVVEKTLTVTGRWQNDDPDIQDARITIPAGKAHVHQIIVNDSDGDPITLRILSGQKSWMRLDGDKLHLTPTAADVGHHRVILQAFDGYEYDTEELDIFVRGSGW